MSDHSLRWIRAMSFILLGIASLLAAVNSLLQLAKALQ
jgi:hypothetical protein